MRLLTTLFASILVSSQVFSQTPELLQLRTYHFDNESQLQATETFLENTYLPALKKKNYDRIGVFRKHTSETDTTLSLYLLLPVEKAESLYDTDHEMMDLFPSEKHFSRVENILLRSFIDMPFLRPSNLSGPRENRIYELRSYESATDKKYINKVDMFNAGGEIILFEDLGFNAVFYAEVIAGDAMPNLMYMTTHQNKEERTKNWKSFVDAPKWKEISGMDKYQNNVSHIDIYLLYPTAYSDY